MLSADNNSTFKKNRRRRFLSISNFFSLKNRDELITRYAVLLTVLLHTGILLIHVVAGRYYGVVNTTIFILICLTLILAIELGFLTFSKYVLILGTLAIPIIISFSDPFYLPLRFGFYFVQIYVLLLISQLFDYSKSIHFYILLTISVIYLIHFDNLIHLIGNNDAGFINIDSELLFFKFPLIVTWIVILISMISYQFLINYKEKKIIQLNNELIEKKHKIEKINSQLLLEAEMKKMEIKRQKGLIDEFIYINAHEVRAPMARIIGLNYLLQRCKFDDREYSEILVKLDHASNELNETISGINKSLSFRNEIISNWDQDEIKN